MSSPESNKCQCQSSSHDHKPGECTKEAYRENLCNECYQHELDARATAFRQPDDFLPRRSNRSFEAVMDSWWQATPMGMPATLRLLPEEHPFYALIGRVASEWAHIEHILDTTIWGLFEADHELVACVTSQMMGVAPRCKAIITLCVVRGLNESIWKPYRALMSDSYDTGDWRNRYVHDHWVMSEPGKATQFRAMSYKDQRFGLVEISKDEINKTLGKIREFQERASYLRADVLAAFAALPKKPA